MDMEKIFVTILAISTYDDYQEVKAGSIVELEKESDNKHDRNAIMVKLDGKQVGYLANNKQSTVLENTLSATDVFNKFEKVAKAEILESVESRDFMNLFKAEFILEKKKKEGKEFNNKKNDKIVNFKLTGGISTYPGKQKLVKDIDKSPRIIKMLLKDDKILGEYEGEPAGTIKEKEENFEVVKGYLENAEDVIATAVSVNRGIVECELEISSAVEIKKVKETIEELINKIVDERINTKTEINEKINYMKKCNVPEVAILSLLESYTEYPEEIRSRIPEKPKTVYIDTNGIVKDSICYINIGSNLLFEGEKGVGKNVLTETLAWLYNRPLYEFSSNSQHSNVSLLGSQTFESKSEDNEEEKNNIITSFLTLMKTVKNIFIKNKAKIDEKDLKGIQKFIYKLFSGHDKNLIFEKSSILEAFENGGIIVLDEFNTSLAHVIPIFNALLDERRRMEITGLGQIKGHPNFTAIATQNKEYEGTFEANEATADRFEPILFPPSNSIVEILKDKVPEVSYDNIVKANELYLKIQSSVRSGELDNQSLSIRGFISACKVLEQGKTLKEALITSVANRIRDEEHRESVLNMIDLLIED